MRSWWDVGKYSGLDSFVLNIFYMIFIVKMMNVVEEQGILGGQWIHLGMAASSILSSSRPA